MLTQGGGCGTVGRVVVSDIKGPLFESNLWYNFIMNILLFTVEKTKIKKKEAGNGQFEKIFSSSKKKLKGREENKKK